MVTKDDIEGFLDRIAAEGGSYSEVEPGLWALKPGGELDLTVVVHFSPPVVILRVKVMELPGDKPTLATLSRRLLELNASDMVHGSYGIDRNDIVLTEALELEWAPDDIRVSAVWPLFVDTGMVHRRDHPATVGVNKPGLDLGPDLIGHSSGRRFRPFERDMVPPLVRPESSIQDVGVEVDDHGVAADSER